MNFVESALQLIGLLFEKAVDFMANCRGKRGTEGEGRSISETKRARTTPTPSAVFEDLANLRRENEQLRRQLQLQSRAQDSLNEIRTDKDCVLTVVEGEPSDVNICNSAEENDKRMLETKAKLESCLFQLNERNLRIVSLENWANAAVQVRLDLESKVEKMQQQLCKELEECGSYADGAATPFLFESTFKAVQMSASSFTKVFQAYIKRHSIDANRALSKHFESPFLTRPAHVAYLLKAWTFKAFFLNFENESFTCGGTSVFLDLDERRVKCYESFRLFDSHATLSVEDRFQQFSRQKLREFLSLWQSADQLTASKLSSEALEDSGATEPEFRLMESFKSMAKGVWALHNLSLSFTTRAEIFRVTHRSECSNEYMESVVSKEDDERFVSKVGFMISPGFRLKKSVLKCQIYLAGDPNFRN